MVNHAFDGHVASTNIPADSHRPAIFGTKRSAFNATECTAECTAIRTTFYATECTAIGNTLRSTLWTANSTTDSTYWTANNTAISTTEFSAVESTFEATE